MVSFQDFQDQHDAILLKKRGIWKDEVDRLWTGCRSPRGQRGIGYTSTVTIKPLSRYLVLP